MKNLIAFIIFLLPLFATAQTTHTVAAKESLFSIGRLYNIHPRELAAYNNIPFETGLTIGQVLKIPAKGNMAPPASSIPAKT
jgi:LysM repeat protein